MIISASRRTDIPAHYSEWFFNRLNEGFVYVRNPFNIHQISKISLKPDVVDCIVFWTKNPENMLPKLHQLINIPYYFQFTLNSYDQTIEVSLPKKTSIIDTFIELSQMVGKDRIIWRYDPIMLTDKFSKEYHYKYYDYLASKLHPYTKKCVISFLDLYTKTQKNMKAINVLPLVETDMLEISRNLVLIADKYGLELETCSENIDLFNLGIKHGKCIDDSLISELIGQSLSIEKDKNQREACGCVASIDIGEYNTCHNHCLYCYANYSKDTVSKNAKKHNPLSPLLIGDIQEIDIITERPMSSFIKKTPDQISMFDNLNQLVDRKFG